jgi:hypothetical protein
VGECRRLLQDDRASRAGRLRERTPFGPLTEALFDRIASSDLLPVLVPGGRLPRDFAARSLRLARERRAALEIEGAALKAATSFLEGRGRRAGARAGREGLPRGLPDGLVARLGRLARDYPGEPEEGLAPRVLALPGTLWVVDARAVPRERARVPGTDIVVGSPLRSGRRRLRASRDPRGAGSAARRLGQALRRVDAAWPEAGAEIRRRTRLILPLTEPALVSFSLPSRPGVSFINLRGKSIVELADDLLHETAHHRLHALERQRGALVTAAARATDAPRLWSPWRRAPRPVRGLLHAVYTFAFRAELLARMAGAKAGAAAAATGGRTASTPLRRALRASTAAPAGRSHRRGAGSAAALVLEAARERRRIRRRWTTSAGPRERVCSHPRDADYCTPWPRRAVHGFADPDEQPLHATDRSGRPPQLGVTEPMDATDRSVNVYDISG